jgi:signal transduction histidine kinase
MTGEIGRVALGEMIGECVAGFDFQLERQGIELSVDLDEPLPPVSGSSTSLRQVLNSLLSNAIEAMPSGGKLEVSAYPSTPDRCVQVRVADSGHGMPKEQVEKLFQPFSTTKGTGLGVGLYLAKRIIERHRGTLELARPAGGGTLATIRLPIAE